jgi:hypothetical protein
MGHDGSRRPDGVLGGLRRVRSGACGLIPQWRKVRKEEDPHRHDAGGGLLLRGARMHGSELLR